MADSKNQTMIDERGSGNKIDKELFFRNASPNFCTSNVRDDVMLSKGTTELCQWSMSMAFFKERARKLCVSAESFASLRQSVLFSLLLKSITSSYG